VALAEGDALGVALTRADVVALGDPRLDALSRGVGVDDADASDDRDAVPDADAEPDGE
jgi:hypothetical protein